MGTAGIDPRNHTKSHETNDTKGFVLFRVASCGFVDRLSGCLTLEKPERVSDS
jgi:hypothetical protein